MEQGAQHRAAIDGPALQHVEPKGLVRRTVPAQGQDLSQVALQLDAATLERVAHTTRYTGIILGLGVDLGPAPGREPEQRQEHHARRLTAGRVAVDRALTEPEHAGHAGRRRVAEVLHNRLPNWQ